jgi:RHS repeat-associated protein
MYRYLGAYGVRWEPATGLYYIRQRWYDPQLARFISRDLLGGVNRYYYGFNSPTNWIDINGLAPAPATPGGGRTVIVVGSPGGDGNDFILAAKTLQQNDYPNAQIVYPYGQGLRGKAALDQTMSAINSSDVNTLIYVGHSGETSGWLAPGVPFNVAMLKKYNIPPTRIKSAKIIACDAGTNPDPQYGFAAGLAQYTHGPVTAMSGTLQFSGYRNGPTNGGFYDAGGNPIDINKNPLPANYPGDVWGVPAHPYAMGDHWVTYPLSPPPPPPIMPGPVNQQ